MTTRKTTIDNRVERARAALAEAQADLAAAEEAARPADEEHARAQATRRGGHAVDPTARVRWIDAHVPILRCRNAIEPARRTLGVARFAQLVAEGDPVALACDLPTVHAEVAARQAEAERLTREAKEAHRLAAEPIARARAAHAELAARLAAEGATVPPFPVPRNPSVHDGIDPRVTAWLDVASAALASPPPPPAPHALVEIVRLEREGRQLAAALEQARLDAEQAARDEAEALRHDRDERARAAKAAAAEHEALVKKHQKAAADEDKLAAAYRRRMGAGGAAA